MNHLGIGVAGKLKPCEACAIHKAKQKPVKKATSTRAEKVGERIFMDISGPFSPSIGGSIYWVLVVDDFSRMGFCGFLKAKSDLAQWMVKLVAFIKSHGHQVKFIRCDNAGENKTAVELLQEKVGGIIPEYTAPHTPQQNGVVERRFPTLKMRALAMMKDANLTIEAKRKLWAEAAMMANILENITLNPKQTKTPFEIFTGRKLRLYGMMIEFGRIGYVKIPEKQRNWEAKAVKCVMVGYAPDHTEDTYRLYNMDTGKIIQSRDVRWAEWEKMKPTDGVSIFERQPELMKQESCIKKSEEYEVVDLDEEDPNPNEVQVPAVDEEKDEEEDQKKQAQQGGMETRAMKERRKREEEEKKALMKTRKLTREMAAEETFKRRITRSMSQAHVAIENEIGEENYRVYLTETEPNEPKTFKQAIESKEAVQWKESMKSEVINFISRGSWKMVNKSKPRNMKKTIVPSKWVFKKNLEQDSSIRFKSRIVSKGYMQVYGIDYKESFPQWQAHHQ